MRLRLALALAIVLAGSAIATDRVSPASPASPAALTASPAAGVLSCPYLTEPKAAAYVALANVGSSPARARIGIGARKGPPLSIPVSLPVGRTVSVPIPAAAAAHASAVIEYSGGAIVAAHMLRVAPATVPVPRPGGAAAASCVRAGGSDVAVTGASTLGSDAVLALFNPGSADADVTVSLIADGRVIEALRLARRIVAAHSRVDFRLGDFAFNARALTAVVHANVGRVVAEVLQRTNDGVELLEGQTPETQAVAIAGQTVGGATVGLQALGPNDAGIDARSITADQTTSVAGVPPDLPPASGRTLQIPDRFNGAPAAYVFDVTVGSPVVATASWTSANGGLREVASLPAAAPAARWGAVVTAFERASTTRAVIVNPSGLAALVHVTILSAAGPATQDVTVPAGRLADISVARGPGTFAVLIASDQPVVLAVRSIGVVKGRGLSSVALIGRAFIEPAAEAVVIDPRVGVPAAFSAS
jgi:hypothetical protein